MTRWMQAVIGLGMVAIVVVFWALGASSRSSGDTTTTLQAVGSTTTTEPSSGTVETAPPATTLPPVVAAGQPGTFVVTDYGAVADGKNDNTAAFQSAVDAGRLPLLWADGPGDAPRAARIVRPHGGM